MHRQCCSIKCKMQIVLVNNITGAVNQFDFLHTFYDFTSTTLPGLKTIKFVVCEQLSLLNWKETQLDGQLAPAKFPATKFL